MQTVKIVLVCIVTKLLVIGASCRQQQKQPSKHAVLMMEGTCLSVPWGKQVMQWRQQQKQVGYVFTSTCGKAPGNN